MASEILGLFTSPEEYQMRQQQAQQQGQQNAALQFAQLNPFERANYGIFQGAQQLGSAGRRLFGGEDPQLRKISLRQQMISGTSPLGSNLPALDFTNPVALRQASIFALQQNRDPEFAEFLAKKAEEVQLNQATITAKLRAKPENVAASVQAAETRADAMRKITDLKRAQKENPTPALADEIAYYENIVNSLPIDAGAKPIEKLEINKRLTALRTDLRALPKGSPEAEDIQSQIDYLSGAKENKPNINKVGRAIGSNKPVFLDENENQMFIYEIGADGKQKRVLYTGGVDQTTTNISQSVSQKGETAFVEKLGALDAKDVSDARGLRDNSIAALSTLNDLAKLNEQDLYTGTYAKGRVGAANLLNTLGLASPKDQAALAASENYQKTSGDLILKTLGGRLGAGFSNEDRKFIEGLVPQLENSAQARRALIERMQRVNEKIIKETTRLEDYARANNGLKGFKPDIPLIYAPKSVAQTYTRAELEAAIAKKIRERDQGKGKGKGD
jgi:hypothetical protein